MRRGSGRTLLTYEFRLYTGGACVIFDQREDRASMNEVEKAEEKGKNPLTVEGEVNRGCS